MTGYKRLIALSLVLVMLFSCFSVVAMAEGEDIKVYIGGVEQELKNPCLIEDGIVYIPLEEVFFKVGVYMVWNELEKCYIGEGNNGEIRITPGLDWIDVDWIPIEIPGEVKLVNGVCMVPIEIIEDSLKVEPAVYDEATKSVHFDFPDINDTPEEPFQIESIVHTLPEGREFIQPGKMFDVDADADRDDALIRTEKVAVEGMPFTEALEIETYRTHNGLVPEASYHIQRNIIIDAGDFESGDVGLMTFWARATKITDESGTARFRPAYEQCDKYNKATDETVSIGYEWKKYYLPLYSGMWTLKAGNSRITYSVGFKPQIIQIADLHVYNYDQQVSVDTLIPDHFEPYKGMEEDHLWRKHAWKRVDKYRKDDMLIRVRDKEGKPIENADVKVDMVEQEFLIGVAICNNEVLYLNQENSKVGQTRHDLQDLFNAGVCGLEMKFYEQRDQFRDGAKMINQWLDRGMRTRGHCLSWGVMGVENMPNYTTATREEKEDYHRKYSAGEAWMFRSTVSEWDVLNEPHDSTQWRRDYGTELPSELFRQTRAIDPKANLIVNETGMEGHPDRYSISRCPGFLQIVNNMKYNERAPIDGLGIQGHCTQYYYPMGFYWDIDRLAQHYDTVTITEYDFLNERYDYAPNHIFDTFLVSYSHPQCNGFVMWGVEDSMHCRYYAPLYNRKWEKKPEYYVWEDIVKNIFVTHESGKTDANGDLKVRGYRGKYEITVNVNGVEEVIEFTLTDSDNTERDNFIDVVVDGNKITATTPNPHEIYATRRVTHDSVEEAYADYIASGADKWTNIYDDRDNNGKTLRLTRDGLQNTYHYIENGGYYEYELCEKAVRGNISVDFRAPLGEVYNYKVLVSPDGTNYKEIYSGSSSEDKTIDYTDTLFIRIVSDNNEYMGISEVDIHAEKE